MAQQKKRPTIVSVQLTPPGKAKLDKACADRGMTIKALLCRLLDWFVTLDRTEQAIVLGQIEARDVRSLADLVGQRGPKKIAAAARRGAR
jgi:hypothetical protein